MDAFMDFQLFHTVCLCTFNQTVTALPFTFLLNISVTTIVKRGIIIYASAGFILLVEHATKPGHRKADSWIMRERSTWHIDLASSIFQKMSKHVQIAQNIQACHAVCVSVVFPMNEPSKVLI